MGMKVKWSYLVALGLTAGIAGWMSTGDVVIGGQSDAKNAEAPPAERVSEVTEKAFRVRVKVFEAIDRTAFLEIRGRTEADSKVTVRAETNGQVLERLVDEGRRVKKGELLCVLDKGVRESHLLRSKAQLAQAEFDHAAATKLQKKGFAADTRVTSLKAKLDAAKAAVAESQQAIARTQIKAPVDGIVQKPVAEIGDMLSVGGVCASIINTDPMLVIGQVSEREIGQISVGMPARATLVTGETVDGYIRFIAPSADAATRTFRVEVEIKNPAGRVRDGVTAHAVVPLAATRAHLLSPAILALADDGRVGVRVIADGNKVKFLPVKLLGVAGDGMWVAGLPERVTVITVGHDYVREGQVVEPVMAETAGNAQ